MLLGEGATVLYAHCGGCAVPWAWDQDPDTIPVVVVDQETLCCFRRDGSTVSPGNTDNTTRLPLCPPCAVRHKAESQRPTFRFTVEELYPFARMDLVDIDAIDPQYKRRAS